MSAPVRKRSWLSYILTAVVIAAIVYYVYINTDEILRYDFQFNWVLMFAALLSAVSGLGLMFMAWERLSRCFGLTAPRTRAASAFYKSQLGKYIPGKVGLVLVRLDAYRGYSRKTVALATGVEYLLSFISACILVLVSTLFIDAGLPYMARWLAVVLLAVMLILLWPPFLKALANRVFKLFKKQPIDAVPTYGNVLFLVLMYTVVGLLFGLSLFLVLNSLSRLSMQYYLAVTGTFWAAALIGIAAVFAPSGIGVREGVMMLVLPSFVPEPTVIVGAILIRLVLIAAELTMAGVSALLEKTRKRNPSSPMSSE